MAPDAFISYSTKDKPTADAVCAALESKGIGCWIAPRDVLPGTSWAGAVVQAIHDCHLMILIFSANANASTQVVQEVERAASRGTAILPLRIDSVVPSEGMELFLGTRHWLDASTPPLQPHLDRLTAAANALLEHAPAPPVPAPPPPSPVPIPLDRYRWPAAVGLTILLAAAALLGFQYLHDSHPRAAEGLVAAGAARSAVPAVSATLGPGVTSSPGTPRPLGRVLARDDFSNPGAGLFGPASSNPSAYRSGYIDAGYQILKVDPKFSNNWREWARTDNFADVAVDVDARVASQTVGGFVKVGCRTPDLGAGNSGYQLSVRPDDGTVWLDRVDKSTARQISPVQRSDAVKQGTESNHLQIRCVGASISGIVNGVQVVQVEDSDYSTGRVYLGAGVVAAGQPGSVDARFNNFVVSEP